MLTCQTAQADAESADVASPNPLHLSEASDSIQPLAEVIVTAQHRVQNSQDIGASVTAVGADRLEEAGLHSGRDIVDLLSGVQAANAYGSQPVFQIRGVGASDFQVSTSPSAGVYRDGVFLSTNVQAGTQMFDLERVEILKGPQGTLYGRNSSAGAINFLTRAPERDFGGYLSADYGRFNLRQLEGAVTGPLGDSLSFRVSAQLLRRGSPFDNISVDPRYPAGSNDAGGVTDDSAVRGQLLYEPSDRVTARLILNYSQPVGTIPNPKSIPDSQAPGSPQACPGRNAGSILANINNPGCVANAGLGVLERSPSADFTLGAGPDGIQPVDNHFYGASSDVEVRLPGVLVSSITAYEAYHNDFGMDYDGTVEPILNLHYIRNLHQYSQELRLSGDIGNTHWLAGTYASYEDLNQNLLYFCGFLNPATLTGSCNYFGAPARAPATAPEPSSSANSVGSDWDRGTTTAAVFSHNEIGLAPRWSAVIGGRYTYDRAAFSGRGFVVYQDGSEQVNNQGGLGSAIGESSLTVHKFTGSVGLNFKPSEKVLTYVSYGEGFKSGGYDGSILNNITALTSPYKPETVDALEMGVKSEPVSHTRINASTFYERYRDPQERINTILPLPGGGTLPTTTLSNLHRATIYGLELEAVWMPTSAISLGSYLTYYHSRVDQPFDPANPSLSQRFNGNELAGAAPVSAVVYGKYDWHLDARYKLQFTANAKYLDTSFTTVENYGTSRQPAYTLVSARAALIDRSGLEVSVWGKNLLNTPYTTVTFLGFGSDTYYPADPLTWGVELRYVF